MKWSFKREIPLLLMILLAFIISAIYWQQVPERVPVHFGPGGEVDRYGSRAEGLLIGPAVILGLYLLFWLLPRIDPGKRNYENFASVYHIMRYGVIGLMFVLHIVIVAYAMGVELSINLIVPPLVGLLFVVLGNLLGKVRPNWFVGIKTPWTLSSKLSWGRTHRLAGRLMVLLGLLLALLGLIGEPWVIWALIGMVLLYVVGIIGYSWWVWRHDPAPVPPVGAEPAREEQP